MRIVAIAQRIEHILSDVGTLTAENLFALVEQLHRLDVTRTSKRPSEYDGRSLQLINEAIEFGEKHRLFSLVMPSPGLEVIIGALKPHAVTIETIEDDMENNANMFRSTRGFQHIRDYCALR